MGERLVQIVDENDKPTRGASYEDVVTLGLRHRIAHIMFVASDGSRLLQQRGANVSSPFHWDFSAAGYGDFGESWFQTAIREVHEETGLVLRRSELRKIEVYPTRRTKEEQGRKIIYDRFHGVFECTVERDTPLTVQQSEVAGFQWYSMPDFTKLISSPDAKLTTSLRHYGKLALERSG